MYLSKLLNTLITNKSSKGIGKLSDVVITNLNTPLPQVVGTVVKSARKDTAFFIPTGDIEEFTEKKITLLTDTINFSPFTLREEETLLGEHMLDKQIVDVSERELTRINDLELSVSSGNIFLTAADVSFRAILNRLGLPTWGLVLKYNSIPWQDIQFLGVNLPVKVKVDYDRLESLHPADIARFIFKGPGYRKGSEIIQSLEEDIAADVIESLPLELQANIIENMSLEAAAKIFSEIESHHAADLLTELSPTRASEILKIVNESQATVVKQLLKYPRGTAGALMKVEFVSIPATTTVEELYTQLRSMTILPEFLLYFYITNSKTAKKLIGVVSVWELFKAQPRERMENIMLKEYVTVSPFQSARSALRRMTQYDLSAIPVVSDEGNILGIITLTHAIKMLIPKSWQTRTYVD